MQPTLCSKSHKNIAVIFVSRIENGETKNEGLCLKCARSMGIKPIDDMMKRMGISDEDLDNLTDEMMTAFNSGEGLEGLVPQDQGDNPDEEEDEEETRKNAALSPEELEAKKKKFFLEGHGSNRFRALFSPGGPLTKRPLGSIINTI